MWIRHLAVTNCAGIAAAGIDLQPGLNVLYGPNELGKSSLVRAVRAALLLQSTSSAAEPLRDWHSDDPATVELTLEQEPQRIWRVVKRFATSGGVASLELSRDGRSFAKEHRGRGVEGALQGILRWGIAPPGGKGGKRGIPESFITTALLGEQSDVVAILRRSLAGDADDSGRNHLAEALQALAEDPRFKAVFATVQEKVREAFTEKGRRRSGRASPWYQLREERNVAEASRRNVQQQLEESEAANERVTELHEQLLAAKAEQGESDAAVAKAEALAARRRNHQEAAANLAKAEAEFKRVAGLVAARDAKVEEAKAAKAAVAELETSHGEAERALAERTPLVAAARERVRTLADGGGEQRRRLREQEAENLRLAIEGELKELDSRTDTARRHLAKARAIAKLAQEIEQRNAELGQQRELLRQAKETIEEDQEALEDLALERDCARYLTAAATLASRQADLDKLREHLAQADACDRKAENARQEAEALPVPAVAEIDRLRTLAAELRVARERLAVGLAVDLTLERAASAVAHVDGERRELQISAGRASELEAERELELEVPGVGVFRVRGGGRDLAREAQAAQEDWDQASQAVYARVGRASLAELDERREQADAMFKAATELENTASEHRIRAEGIDRVERDVVATRADRDFRAAAVAEYLEEGFAADEYIGELDDPPRLESVIETEIADHEARVRERQCLSQELTLAVDVGEIEVGTQEHERAALREEIGEVDAEEWQQRLEGDEVEREELRRQLQSVATELADIRSEATAEVAEARRTLAEREDEEAAANEELSAEGDRLANATTRLARLEGQADQLRLAADAEDLESARAIRDEHRSQLAALPVPDDEDELDLGELTQAAQVASSRVRNLEAELRRNEGALEQVGGQYIREQAQQAEEAMKALDQRERDLELEYGAWRLLHETLTVAEKEDAAHLGSTLVAPVSKHVAGLTRGRYGELAIGPQLDATGIELAGSDREFTELSVGTQEQIALLLRIAIAKALGSFVILDDQLTQSDASRMAWIRGLLAAAANDIQVVVLTCHPEDYEGDGDGHVVDLRTCLRRSDGADDDPGPGSETRSEPERVPVGDDHSAPRKVPRRRRRRDSAGDQTDDVAAALRASLARDEDG